MWNPYTTQNMKFSIEDFVSNAEGLQLYLKKTLAQVFYCEFCEISKNTFFHRIPLVAASEILNNKLLLFTVIAA